tara:strand:+ start:371 stop:478 length:108 start_codon:yes stop_codon:yes gene_type:complete
VGDEIVVCKLPDLEMMTNLELFIEEDEDSSDDDKD